MAREHWEQAKKLLLKLHELDVQGKAQTPEADEIRAQMEGPERYLTQLERERLDGLSADLYMISGTEVRLLEAPSPKVCEEILGGSDWDRKLAILRARNLQFSESNVACGRAVCWIELGDFDVALVFARHAFNIDQDNAFFRLILVECFLRLGRERDALKLFDDHHSTRNVYRRETELQAAGA